MVDVVLVGAGLRGMLAYGGSAEAAGVRFVAVVEPDPERRRAFAELHGLAEDRCFSDVASWLAAPELASAALIATPDDQHLEPALAALGAGYDVLLEKPMAQSAAECVQLVETAERLGRRLHVCHVLRYTPFFRAVRDVVASGRLGRIVTVEHRENVDARHMAHSYVRGAYRRADASNPMLLAKSCHDLDLLHWILDDPVVRVSSFGSLLHFRPESVGPEIPARCTDGCPVEATCTFSALDAYAPEQPVATPEIRLLTQIFPLGVPAVGDLGHDRGARLDALRTSAFGRCVYRCDNDVVDHQVVAMELASGASATFTMHGHSHDETRTMRYDGTRATLRATFAEEGSEITIHDHGASSVERVPLPEADLAGHGGGDLGVLRAFATGAVTTDGRSSLESHLVGWAAEEARRQGTVVELAEFRQAVLGAGLALRLPPPSTARTV